MSHFDELQNSKNLFVKSHPFFLKMMFGTNDFVPLWIADMDFKVAPEITEAIHEIAERGVFSYEFTAEKVIESIVQWNLERHQLDLRPKNFVQVTTGVLTALYIMIEQLTEEGEEIVIQTPVYHQFEKVIQAAKRKVVVNQLKLENGKYSMDLEDLEQTFKSTNAKTLILCNPHNPVGRVWNREELQALLTLADRHSVTILSDEIHSEIVFEGSTFNSIASFEEGRKHITILGSPAKTFGMHSIANGFFYTENEFLKEKLKAKISGMYLDHGNALSGYATIAAYTKGGKWVDELVDYLAETIKWINDFLKNELPQVKLIQPEGTYQIWLDFSGLGLKSEGLKSLIIENAKVGLAPGEWFGADHEQFMRMNIASPRIVIQDAFHSIKKALISTKITD